MITLKEYLEATHYRIVEVESWRHPFTNYNYPVFRFRNEAAEACLVYDSVQNEVIFCRAFDRNKNRSYYLVHADYDQRENYDSFNYQNVKSHKLETDEDFLEKLNAILNGIPYDERIVIPLDLTKEEKLTLMELAHEKDMSLNKFVEYLIENVIHETKLNQALQDHMSEYDTIDFADSDYDDLYEVNVSNTW